jgi:hypothetical protein
LGDVLIYNLCNCSQAALDCSDGRLQVHHLLQEHEHDNLKMIPTHPVCLKLSCLLANIDFNNEKLKILIFASAYCLQFLFLEIFSVFLCFIILAIRGVDAK